MLLSEAFAPTIQGEGIHAGQRVGFIRLANCNLACSWCDTKYSWDWKNYDKHTETKEWANHAVASLVREWWKVERIERVILTGGEPMMQQSDLVEMITDLRQDNSLTQYNTKFDVETNGTIAPTESLAELIDMFVVSPKLSHSGDIANKRLKPALNTFADLAHKGKAVFKFVIGADNPHNDLAEVYEIQRDYGIPRTSIWLMPEGTTVTDIVVGLGVVAPLAIDSGYNISPRLHTIIWGQRRGV